MTSFAGERGSAKRRLVVCGVFAVGVAVLLLAGHMMELSAKQVYWAVYSRLHPMRSEKEAYSYFQHSDRRRDLALNDIGKGTGNPVFKSTGHVEEGVEKGSAAAAAVAAGEKHVVALLPVEKEHIRRHDHEMLAAKEAHQREAEVQEAKESKRVQDVAEQQLAKATAAFSAEITAVAGPEEAGRLQSKWDKEDTGQTKLEKEAAATSGKDSFG